MIAPLEKPSRCGRPGFAELTEVTGQEWPKRALEIAAAGGHSVLLVGPPDARLAQLARCLPGLLPGRSARVIRTPVRPREPRGLEDSAGEVSDEVLVVDDFLSQPRRSLHALAKFLQDRGPATGNGAGEDGAGKAWLPLLAATAQPCPCGYLGDARRECLCSPRRIERYRRRLTPSLLDCFDLRIEVCGPGDGQAWQLRGETTAVVAARVAVARAVQRSRFEHSIAPVLMHGVTPRLNAHLTVGELLAWCPMEPSARRLLAAAEERLSLSPLAMLGLLRLARTAADLAGRSEIAAPHVAEAIQLRGPWS